MYLCACLYANSRCAVLFLSCLITSSVLEHPINTHRSKCFVLAVFLSRVVDFQLPRIATPCWTHLGPLLSAARLFVALSRDAPLRVGIHDLCPTAADLTPPSHHNHHHTALEKFGNNPDVMFGDSALSDGGSRGGEVRQKHLHFLSPHLPPLCIVGNEQLV